MTSAEQAAAQAQKTLQPGSGKCVLCGEDVWRYKTSGDTQHLTMFDEVEGGCFDFPDTDGNHPDVAPYLGVGDGALYPHSCLQDAT